MSWQQKRERAPGANQRSSVGVHLVAFLLAVAVQFPLFSLLEVRADRDQARVQKKAKTRIQLVEPPPKGQMVTLPTPEKKVKPPPDARFLARDNHKVKKEQKARTRTPGPQVRAKKTARKRSKIQSRDSRSLRTTRLKKPKRAKKPNTVRSRREHEKSDRKAGLVSSRAMPNLDFPEIPQTGVLGNVQAVTSTGGSDDALPMKREGSETLLNARRYRFISFFERVKEQVRNQWSPNQALSRRDPTGKAFCCRDRYTRLQVRIDKEGNILDLKVVKGSGLRFLDSESLRAFRTAGPFPNPPDALFAEEKEHFEFRFGFLLEFRDGQPFTKWVPPSPL